MWGTEVARGYQIVQTWASRAELVVDCGKKEHRLREIASALGECNVVIVHIKRICTNLLAEFPAAVHVQDVLDGGEIRKGTHGMCAVVTSYPTTMPEHKYIPHHGMTCKTSEIVSWPREQHTVLFLGMHEQHDDDIRKEMAAWAEKTGAQVLFEYDLKKGLAELQDDRYHDPTGTKKFQVHDPAAVFPKLCQEIGRATIAVAWDQHAAYRTKPNERVTNPQSLGVPTLAFSAYSAFKDAIALKENLVDNVKALKARLTELVQSRDEWERCHNASLQSAGRFSLDTIVKQYYEPLRDYVLQHCGCDSAGPT
jgi:hypothetical protein